MVTFLFLQGLGRVFVAPYSDEYLQQELYNKAAFWSTNNFYSVNLSSLYYDAIDTTF